MPKNLIICRAGDNSLHPNWLQPQQDKNFDFWVNYFGGHPGKYADNCDYYWASGGTKYPQLYEFFSCNWDMLTSYDAIWLPDDDINTNAATINKMFQIFHQYQLWLAQPSLSNDSFYSHLITLQVPNRFIRFTNFVEVMIPVFSLEALHTCFPTFQESTSGWGLDFLWPKIMGNPSEKIAIIDAVVMNHSRQIFTGEIYQQISRHWEEELNNVVNNHSIALPYEMVTYKHI